MSEQLIRLAPTLPVPIDWMLLNTIVYGVSGAGKSTAGRRWAEELIAAGQRFCAIDDKGDWSGLKSSSDGTKEGLPVVIFGGEHADLPLEPGSGSILAETISGLDQSCILDFELFSTAQRTTLLADFFETLYRVNRKPLTLLCDEVQGYGPQIPLSGRTNPDAERCLYAIIEIAKKGRKHALGRVFFTQRGATVHKDISEIADLLVTFRAPGALDQERIKKWLGGNYSKSQIADALSQLSGLPNGSALFASGHPMLRTFGVHAVPMPWTFDSSATPKIGERKKEPAVLSKPAIASLRAKLASSLEKIQSNDPKSLQLALAEERGHRLRLEKQLEENTKVEQTVIPMWDPEAFAELQKKLSDHAMLALNNSKGALHVYQSKCMATNGATGGLGGTPRAAPSLPKRNGHDDIVSDTRAQNARLGLLPPLSATGLRYPQLAPEGWTPMEEDLYQKFKARLIGDLRKEAPELLKVLATAPELELHVERKVLTFDAGTAKGRIAQLITEGFFAKPTNANVVWKELLRLGLSPAKPNVYRDLKAFAAGGFLTIENEGYMLAPGAKVRLKKAG